MLDLAQADEPIDFIQDAERAGARYGMPPETSVVMTVRVSDFFSSRDEKQHARFCSSFFPEARLDHVIAALSAVFQFVVRRMNGCTAAKQFGKVKWKFSH